MQFIHIDQGFPSKLASHNLFKKFPTKKKLQTLIKKILCDYACIFIYKINIKVTPLKMYQCLKYHVLYNRRGK